MRLNTSTHSVIYKSSKCWFDPHTQYHVCCKLVCKKITLSETQLWELVATMLKNCNYKHKQHLETSLWQIIVPVCNPPLDINDFTKIKNEQIRSYKMYGNTRSEWLFFAVIYFIDTPEISVCVCALYHLIFGKYHPSM